MRLKPYLLPASIIVLAIYLWPSFGPVRPVCLETPTLDCLKDYLSSARFPKPSDNYWSVASDLADAGLDKQAIKAVKKSGAKNAGLNDIALAGIAAMKVAVEAKQHPEKIADFTPIDDLDDTDTEIGRLAAQGQHGDTVAQAYHKLAFLLLGAIGDGGDQSYVQLMEENLHSNLASNATWNELIKRWSARAAETGKPGEYVSMAARLIDAGDAEQAKKWLQAAGDLDSINRTVQSQTYMELKDYDAALRLTSHEEDGFSPYYVLVQQVEDLLQNGETAKAEPLFPTLIEAAKKQHYLRPESIVRICGLLHKAGRQEEAIALADWLNNIVTSPHAVFTDPLEGAQAFESAGDKERARILIKEAAAKLRGGAGTPVGDQKNSDYAVTFYGLGLYEEAKNMLANTLDPSVHATTWINIYKTAYEKNVQKPDVEEMIADVANYLHPYVYTTISAFHLQRGEKGLGKSFLDQAIRVAENADTTSVTCEMAFIANRMGYAEVLDTILEKAIVVGNKPPEQRPSYAAESLYLKQPIKRNGDPYRLMYLRNLQTVRCFNLIVFDRIQ